MDLKEMGMSPFNWADDLTGDKFKEWKLDNPNYDYVQPITLQIQLKRQRGNLVFDKIISAADIYRKAVKKEDKQSSRTLLGDLLLSNNINIGHYMAENGREYVDNLHRDLHKGLKKMKAENETNIYENLTITKWNEIHLCRPAAEDLEE
ncbi:hypothetical protein A8C32_10045 [Flavivirga aquatica]|uniref:Uncharacterized protein n=1 Tax=Flavivirga aquatica TaxID=1849968 RepID=A0A1E5TEN5_9FLAO|nr:hypothetical protein [Flavivirga aquatica]OEK09843.1 hypothetical protein A8C32_10045 [Flavivirga aquatica]